MFENTSHHFGTIVQGKQLSYTFQFKNVGKSDLIIYNLDASCGCTRPVPSREFIKPEETGEITITIDTKEKKNGEMTSYVVVTANTYPAQTVLELHANILNSK